MANTTRAGALSIHGTNPQVSLHIPPLTASAVIDLQVSLQYLVPTVIRQRVYDTLYWSEQRLYYSHKLSELITTFCENRGALFRIGCSNRNR